jgi:hypothetical protein
MSSLPASPAYDKQIAERGKSSALSPSLPGAPAAASPEMTHRGCVLELADPLPVPIRLQLAGMIEQLDCSATCCAKRRCRWLCTLERMAGSASSISQPSRKTRMISAPPALPDQKEPSVTIACACIRRRTHHRRNARRRPASRRILPRRHRCRSPRGTAPQRRRRTGHLAAARSAPAEETQRPTEAQTMSNTDDHDRLNREEVERYGQLRRFAAHPTIYNGHTFRSSLEARWAAYLLHWRWAYEPLDLHGWVPEFVLVAKRNPCWLK